MKILILGGTLFLGRHLVEAALARGHEVTLFNRGKTNPGLYPEVEELHGDRSSDLSALVGRAWEVVIDTSGYVPRHVRATAELVGETARHYTFVSSMSVYPSFEPGTDEDAPLAQLEDEGVETVTGETYGGLKALCEQAVEAVMPGRALHARAGLIVGPYDPINRFPYWVERVPRGGEVLAPGHPSRPLQLIDARDLSNWLIEQAERGTAGAFNLTGPDEPLSFGEFLATIKGVSGGDARFVWADDDFLIAQGIEMLDGLPLWLPEQYLGFFRRGIAKALAAGLTFRPLSETVRDTLAWLPTRPTAAADKPGVQIKSGLTPEREAELLALWQQQQASV
jgi:2'-hydroxyisoflavone reductase